MLKRILIGLAVLFVFFIGAVLILPGLVPTDTYRTKLEADLSRAFARDVTISGDIDISTFPVLKVETGSVSLANPEGFPEGQFVDVEAMSAKVKLWPLLRKRVEISGVTLKSPSIRLEKQADGRANWMSKEAEETTDKGPFKRDGRFTEYDPALALLRIENGNFEYVDATTSKTVKLEDVNLDLRAPGLAKPLSLSGNFLFDGLSTEIDAGIESPADFLNGLETGFNGDITTAEGEIEVTGRFLSGEDIAMTAEFDAAVPKPNALAARLPLPADLDLPSLTSAFAKGKVAFSPASTNFPEIEIGATGAGLDAAYTGNFSLTEGATNAGAFTAKISDLSIIEPYLEEPVQAMDVVSSLEAKGNVAWTGQRFTLTNIETDVLGSDLKANFTGSAGFDEALTLDGQFNSETANVAALVAKAGIDQPDAAALKRLTAKGKIIFADGKAVVSNLTAEATDGLLNGDFTGDISTGENLDLNGTFSGEIRDLGALDAALPREIPYSDVVKRISLTSDIQSQSGSYALSNLAAKLQDGLLNGDFEGKLTLGETSDISGALTLSADSLRQIATSQNIVLPASTDVGPIFETFALSGQVSGTPQQIKFNNGEIKLDQLSGSGDFIMEMNKPKPELTGALSLSPLDLRPYMAAWSAQNPTGTIQPWSDDPISISGLESLDAKIDITTPSIITDRLELGDTAGQVNLRNGTLTADLDKTKLYGGDAAGKFSLTSQNGVPAIAIDATIKSVTAQNFFMASGGFDKITGTSDLTMSFTGSGQSQADIMKSLTGDGIFKVIKGQLLGLDANSLLTGVEQAITTRALPTEGLGLGGTTAFNDIDSRFSLENGRATLSGFQLKSGGFSMDADGTIDIGQQTIDIGIRPKLAGTSDLANFGIPLRFTGGFGQAKAKLDTDFLGDIATAKARAKAGNLVKDRLGDSPVGGLLGNIIGGNTSEDTATTPAAEAESAPAAGPEENAASETQKPDPKPETSEPETLEDVGEDLLKGLFGRKKKNEKTE